MQAGSEMTLTAYRPLQYEAAPKFPLGPWGRASLSGAAVSTCERLLENPPGIPPNRRYLCVSKATALTAEEVQMLMHKWMRTYIYMYSERHVSSHIRKEHMRSPSVHI